MKGNSPVIEILYPEVANLFGDIGNVEYLKASIPEAVFTESKLSEEPRFMTEAPDMIYIGPMSEHSQELVLERLFPCRERIARLIDGGTVFLATGNSLELFGEKILCEDGREIDCLGLFETYAKRRMMKRFNTPIFGKFGDIRIVGFKSQFTQSYGDNSNGYFIDIEKGCGLNPESKKEGLMRNNFIATYTIGPILPMNPLLVRHIKGLLGCENVSPAFEAEAMDAYNRRVSEMERLNF